MKEKGNKRKHGGSFCKLLKRMDALQYLTGWQIVSLETTSIKIYPDLCREEVARHLL
jgi:hypothetical protein